MLLADLIICMQKFLQQNLEAAQIVVQETAQYIAAQALRLHEIEPQLKSVHNLVSEVDINAEILGIQRKKWLEI